MNLFAIRAAGGLYSLAWTLARPFLRRNPRLADGFAERLVPPDWAGFPGTGTGGPVAAADVWIQAASGGEARLACALLEELEKRKTPLTVLLTTWTRQGRDILEAGIARLPANGPVRALARFVPLDDPALMRRALAQSGVRLLVLLETEIWPGLLLACREAGVPVLLTNGRLRERTLRNYLRSACLWRGMAPARIAAISEADAGRFRRLFPAVPVTVAGNIKFDQAAPAAPAASGVAPAAPDIAPPLLSLLTGEGRRPVVLFASVREEEEAALRDVLQEPAVRESRLIVAPRHMRRIAAWGALLDGAGLSWASRSSFSSAPRSDADAILWDAFGELPWLYRMADATFVGGSLAPLGGQNFLEALAAGTTPFVGPHLDNFAWALGDEKTAGATGLAQSGLVRVVPDARALAKSLGAAVARGPLADADRAATRARFAAWLAPRRGGTAAQAEVILEMLRRQ
jgi:3-deoxy-D-manno-octulosonic-acid transferase